MEYMDGGSIDKLYGSGIQEDVLGKITLSVKFISLYCNFNLFYSIHAHTLHRLYMGLNL